MLITEYVLAPEAVKEDVDPSYISAHIPHCLLLEMETELVCSSRFHHRAT